MKKKSSGKLQVNRLKRIENEKHESDETGKTAEFRVDSTGDLDCIDDGVWRDSDYNSGAVGSNNSAFGKRLKHKTS